jgi:hypothetical protein
MTVAERGCWKLEMLGKIGIGNMHQNVRLRGEEVVTHPPPFEFLDDVRGGGLYTRGIGGSYTRDVLTIVPEARIKLLRSINCHLDVSMGYSFIYWNHVALAGGNVQTRINPQNRTFAPQDAAFFAQGLEFDIRVHY